MKAIKGHELVNYIGKNNCATLGNAELSFKKVGPINASSADSLSFCNVKGEMAMDLISNSKSMIILCRKDTLRYNLKLKGKFLIAVDNPRLWFLRCIVNYFPNAEKSGIHPTAVIGDKCKIGKDAYIGPYVCIGNNVKIGHKNKIYSGVHINDGVTIGNNVVLKSGCCIGFDGFGYERNENEELEKFPHIGSVIIEDYVEVGSNTCIDRGTLVCTLIGRGTKIDNAVHIGHNATIGKHCIITAKCMIGRSVIGDYSWIGPSSCVKPGVNIGRRAFIGLGSVVTKDVPENAVYVGSPAREINEFKKYLKFIKTNIRE